ncbi:hypothetical protein KCU66_g23, partial [Aureobasidium melanogenum]
LDQQAPQVVLGRCSSSLMGNGAASRVLARAWYNSPLHLPIASSWFALIECFKGSAAKNRDGISEIGEPRGMPVCVFCFGVFHRSGRLCKPYRSYCRLHGYEGRT